MEVTQMTIWINDNPVYTPSPIPEFQNNPIIECLSHPPLTDDEAIRRLAEFPRFNEAERSLPRAFRKFLPARLTRFLFPTTSHVRVLNQIYIQVMDAYSLRNPLSRDGQGLLHSTFPSPTRGLPVVEPYTGRLSTISMICGLSGMGKSTLVRGCMRVLGKPVIRHSHYHNIPFPETQILYLMRNVPDQCTPKTFCKAYGDYADALLEMNLYSKMFADKSSTRTHYLSQLGCIIKSHHVGALVLDCVEHLTLAPGGYKGFIAMLVNMRDQLKVPIILVGTYKAAEILGGAISGARRLVEGGFHDLARPLSSSDPDFSALSEAMWEMQWVTSPVPFDDKIKEVLFKLSQGITGLMLTLFVAAQIEAIDSGSERVDTALLRKVYERRFQPLHKIIEALESGEKGRMDHYDDLYLKAFEELTADPLLNGLDHIQRQMNQSKERELGVEPTASEPSTAKTRRTRKAKGQDFAQLLAAVAGESTAIPTELA
jgi:AAA domain-containing protein